MKSGTEVRGKEMNRKREGDEKGKSSRMEEVGKGIYTSKVNGGKEKESLEKEILGMEKGTGGAGGIAVRSGKR